MRLFPTYQYYLGTSYLDGNIRFASVVNFLVGLSILAFGIYTNYHNKTIQLSNIETFENDGKNMLLFLLVGVAITFVSFKFNLLDRVGQYFFVFSVVYLPNALKSISEKKERILL